MEVNTIVSSNYKELSRKRQRRSRDYDDDFANSKSVEPQPDLLDVNLFDVNFPSHLEAQVATAIFDLGLKHASPKIILPLMPYEPSLNSEHLKSHLQKYRIHRQRSKDEFYQFYEDYFQKEFQNWEEKRGWEQVMKKQKKEDGSCDEDLNPFEEEIDQTTLQENKIKQLQEKIDSINRYHQIIELSNKILHDMNNDNKDVIEKINKAMHEIQNILPIGPI